MSVANNTICKKNLRSRKNPICAPIFMVEENNFQNILPLRQIIAVRSKLLSAEQASNSYANHRSTPTCANNISSLFLNENVVVCAWTRPFTSDPTVDNRKKPSPCA